MDKAISAADANRQFSRVLREVREGRSYVVTAHGEPVAKIVPINAGDQARAGARRALLAKLRGQKPRKVGRWTRDELYDDRP
ncbi:MAG TPA: type II toxin-antitoxin system prevent-host-death family antitoxin [Stellaceae bacterium]|nr:type II toxin-antitoxin system prevent-host-death family antitoxin [Stellaceae bacterium]